MPKSRLEAFSDAIIAFAITLLILDIHPQDVSPDINNASMIDALHALVPQFSPYTSLASGGPDGRTLSLFDAEAFGIGALALFKVCLLNQVASPRKRFEVLKGREWT